MKKSFIAHPALIVIGCSLLLISAYYDNIRGPLLPILQQDLSLSYKQSSFIFVVGHIAGILFTLLLRSLVESRGAKFCVSLGLIISIITAVAGVMIHDLATLFVVAALVGLVISGLGTFCNIYVIRGSTPEGQTKILSGLHSMYGLGSFFAASTCGFWFAKGLPWQYLFLLPIGFCIVLWIWNHRLHLPHHPSSQVSNQAEHSAPDTSLNPTFMQHAHVLLLFALYVGAEVMISMWMSTYVTSTFHYSAANASTLVSGFFLMMTLTRLAGLFFIKPKYESRVLLGALIIPGISFLLGYFYNPLFLVGAGLFGPYFPILLSQVSRRFPNAWQRITVNVILCMQIILGLAHLGLGALADSIGMKAAYGLPGIMIGLIGGLLVGWVRGRCTIK